MIEEKTEALINSISIADVSDDMEKSKSLFVCHGRTISEYPLEGTQYVGRPTEDFTPDIPVFDRFVSRKHGMFETSKEGTEYTVLKTTNGVLYKGELLEPGTKLSLSDGDELILPSRYGKEGSSVILVYVSSEARRHLWQELRQASKDELTGLHFRDSFIIWWYQNCTKKDYASANLFILDVDDFKQVNDKKGHEAGDEALRIVASQLRSSVRYEGQVCRWGGDEFVGVVPGTQEQAKERLLNLGRQIEAASTGAGLPVTVSIGFVNFSFSSEVFNVLKLVSLADNALYKAKQGGKRNVEFFSA